MSGTNAAGLSGAGPVRPGSPPVPDAGAAEIFEATQTALQNGAHGRVARLAFSAALRPALQTPARPVPPIDPGLQIALTALEEYAAEYHGGLDAMADDEWPDSGAITPLLPAGQAAATAPVHPGILSTVIGLYRWAEQEVQTADMAEERNELFRLVWDLAMLQMGLPTAEDILAPAADFESTLLQSDNSETRLLGGKVTQLVSDAHNDGSIAFDAMVALEAELSSAAAAGTITEWDYKAAVDEIAAQIPSGMMRHTEPA